MVQTSDHDSVPIAELIQQFCSACLILLRIGVRPWFETPAQTRAVLRENGFEAPEPRNEDTVI